MGEVWYDAKEDVLGIQLKPKGYDRSVEISERVIVDISKEGEIIGIEILGARDVFKKDAPLVISRTVGAKPPSSK